MPQTGSRCTASVPRSTPNVMRPSSRDIPSSFALIFVSPSRFQTGSRDGTQASGRRRVLGVSLRTVDRAFQRIDQARDVLQLDDDGIRLFSEEPFVDLP